MLLASCSLTPFLMLSSVLEHWKEGCTGPQDNTKTTEPIWKAFGIETRQRILKKTHTPPNQSTKTRFTMKLEGCSCRLSELGT